MAERLGKEQSRMVVLEWEKRTLEEALRIYGDRARAGEARVTALEGGIRDVLRIVRTEPHTHTDEVIERRLAGLFPAGRGCEEEA